MNDENFHDISVDEKDDDISFDDSTPLSSPTGPYKMEEVVDNPVEEDNGLDKKKLLIIFVILAVILSSLAFLVGYTFYRNDPAPKISTVHIESDNFDDHSVAKYGNMVTLTFTFNEEIKGYPKVMIQGKEVEVFGEGREFYAKYFIQDQDYEKEEIHFTISEYKDYFYKVGNPVVSTTDGSKVVILAFGE